MPDDDVLYAGVAAAAAAVGVKPGRVQRLIADRFLKTTRGGSGPAGGRPAHLIRRGDLVHALKQLSAWEREQARRKPPPSPPAPPRGPNPPSTRMTRRRRKVMGKLRREFFPFRPKPRAYNRNRLRRK